MYTASKQSKSKPMDIGSLIKCVLIAALILAGYFVVSNTAAIKVKPPREGFTGSGDVPNVVAEKSSNLITTGMQNMLGLLQVSNNRKTYETLVISMDPWTQAKVVASLNALAAQMVADSSDQTAMKSAPSEKTISLMNAINTMTTFQTTALPAVMKYISNA
jgi:hypothetical protein